MSPHIALFTLMVVAFIFMYAGPALIRNLGSPRPRACGVTALHLAHFDAPCEPNRATRRQIHIGKRLWFMHDETGAVTLAQAKLNVHDDIDFAVIDEFRKSSYILDNITFHDAVSAGGQGATLTYGYNRVVTQALAGFRAINSEYTPGEATKERHTVDLKPLGGAFEIDRVLAAVARGGEVSFQMAQKIKAARSTFHDAAINGDTGADANAFDGLDVALAGSTTEFGAADNTYIDLSSSALTTTNADEFIDLLDAAIEQMDGRPTFIGGNGALISKIKSIGRRKGYYERTKNDFGNLVETYGDTALVNLGDKPGSSEPVVSVEARDFDNATYTVTVTGVPTGGTFSLAVTVGDGAEQETAAIAFDADAAAIDAALSALDDIVTADVTVTGTTTKTVVFGAALAGERIQMSLEDNGLTGGTAPSVTVTESAESGVSGLTDLYLVRLGMDGFHGVSLAGQPLVRTWLPDFSQAGAVKKGEVEMVTAVALKATKAAAVLRNIKVR